jgi:CubicO group peptidase (beta-lactamase class C family)
MIAFSITALRAAAAVLLLGCVKSVRVNPRDESQEAIVRREAGARLDRYLTRAAAFGFSGAVLVADASGIVLYKGYGVADEARSVPIRPDMLFDMGSIVKQFTAAAILLLESEGKLSTSDSLRRFFLNAPSEKASITLHQVLTHTAGITDNRSGDYANVGRDSALNVIWNVPLLSPPGQQFNYSNAGFSLLAAIIEQVSGQSYEPFMRDRIFGPAGMRETGYHLPGLDTSRVAHTFTPPVDHDDPATRLARANGPSWNLMGNGGMLTTVMDLYQYELALRRGRPVSHQIQAKQFAEQFRRSPTLVHGYDWWIEPADDGGVHYNRAGDAPSLGLNAEYRRYPKDSTVFILLANTRHHGASTRRFVMPNLRRVYLGTTQLDLPATQTASPAQLEPVTGVYRLDSSSYFVVRSDRGRLVVSALGQNAVNAIVFYRDTTSIRNRARSNDRMVATIKALATQDSAAALAALGSPGRASRLLGAWRDAEKEYGPFRCVQVLGTDRLDRGVFLTTVRLRFADSVKTVRSTWNQAIPIVNSDDAALVNNFGFAIDSPVDAGAWSPYWWLSGSDSIVTYDLLTNQTLRGWVQGAANGSSRELVLDVPGRPVRAMRINDDAALGVARLPLSCLPARGARPAATAIARAIDSPSRVAIQRDR